MKNKLMFVVSAALLALTGLSANANTIGVGTITTAPDGSGGVLWTYPIIFNNSTISSSQPTSFNLNDFGAIKTGSFGMGGQGWSFAPTDASAAAVPFTLDNSQFVGPNFGLPGFQPNNPGIKDVVVTFTGNANMAQPQVSFNLVLDSASTGTGPFANFFSQDIVQTGDTAGSPNAIQQNIITPAQVPESSSLALFAAGAAMLIAFMFFRRLFPFKVMNAVSKFCLLAGVTIFLSATTSSFAQDVSSDETLLIQDPFQMTAQTLQTLQMPLQVQPDFPLPEGSVLPNYVVVSVGPNASVTVNSGPIKGNVLLGDGTTSSSSGGGNGQVTGEVDVSPVVSGDNLSHIQIAPTIVTVASSVGTTAFNDAVSLSNAASALAPTQTFGAVTGSLTINGNGGLNVIDITSLSNPNLTINGGPNDNFVFNISGNFSTNHVMVLNGVTASQILWNMTGTSGNIFQTSGGDVLFGTFLATHGGDFQFSNLVLTGQLINTDGHMQIVSGSQVVPEPNTYGLIGIGAIALAWARKRWNRS